MEERNYLDGWSAQGSDMHARVAVRVISNLQRLVLKVRMDKPLKTPLQKKRQPCSLIVFCARTFLPEDHRALCT